MTLRKVCLPTALALVLPLSSFAGQVSFQNHSNNMTTGGDSSFYHADFNNDGREDLAYIYQPSGASNGTFDVEFTDGSENGDVGLFTGPFSYQVPPHNGSTDVIAQLALGDFNHDGSMDIAAFTIESGNVYIYLNDGKGSFSLGGTYSFGPSGGTIGSVSAAVADFNHDQLFDLAFIVDGRLNIWFGDGKAGFTPVLAQSVNGQSLAMGDFDGDGKADLLIYRDPAAISSAYVYYGDGTGHFPQSITLSLPKGFAAFSAGDVNTDGKMDVMAVDSTVSSNRIYVFYGDSSRKFSSRTSIAGARCLADVPVQAADLDGNGQNDLIFEDFSCANPSTGPLYVDVLTRNADSSYNPHQTIYWPIVGVDAGTNLPIDQPPIIRNADGNSKPDILVQQCIESSCGIHWDTTLYNATAWSFSPCDPPTATGINVCSPFAATVATPVPFAIGATGTAPMRDIEIWVDGSKRAEQRYGFSNYAYFNGNVSLNAGHHNVTIVAAGWDQSKVTKSFKIDVR
jgi:FG-GAP-like repeat/FG-GAP repeat